MWFFGHAPDDYTQAFIQSAGLACLPTVSMGLDIRAVVIPRREQVSVRVHRKSHLHGTSAATHSNVLYCASITMEHLFLLHPWMDKRQLRKAIEKGI